MVASLVVVAAYSLNKSSVIQYVVIVLVGVVGIMLGLEIVDCFNASLKFSGLGGCGV